MKDLQGYRTVIFNGVSLLAFAADKAFNLDILTGNVNTIAEFIILIGNIYLRTKTTTPIGKKNEKSM